MVGQQVGVLAGIYGFNIDGTFGWLLEGSAVRPWTYTHNTLPSYSHLHQPLGHPAGANFIEGRARIRAVMFEDYTLRISYLHRVQGRSEGGGEQLLSYAVGEMPWTSFSEREGEDGHAWLQGVRTRVSRLEIDLSLPWRNDLAWPGLRGLSGVDEVENQELPRAWENPWNADGWKSAFATRGSWTNEIGKFLRDPEHVRATIHAVALQPMHRDLTKLFKLRLGFFVVLSAVFGLVHGHRNHGHSDVFVANDRGVCIDWSLKWTQPNSRTTRRCVDDPDGRQATSNRTDDREPSIRLESGCCCGWIGMLVSTQFP